MDLDDGPKRKDTPIEAVEAEKLDGLSVEYRIRVLKRETLRSEAELEEKTASKAAAEDVFRK